MKPQEVFDRAKQIAKKIAKFNDAEPFKKIYRKELNNFNTDCLVLKELLNKLGKHGAAPINKLRELIKNKQISLSDDALLALVIFCKITMPIDISTDVAIFNYSHLQPDEIDNLINWIQSFPNEFVDMHILHAIAQNEKTPIIVVAGSLHTNHIVKRLQQCNYTVKKSIEKDDPLSAVNLKTVFSNLEQAAYVQRSNNFFRHFWKKIIAVFYQICW